MSRLTHLLRHLFDPEAIVARQTAPLYRSGFPVAVCWSAKAGCTTVLKWFLHHAGLLDAALLYAPWPHTYRMQVLMHPISEYVATCKLALQRGDVDVVKVVRDPARRAVSAYLHLLRWGEDPTWNPGIDPWKQRVGLGRQTGLSFEQFLHFVIDMRSVGRQLDPHFSPQWNATWEPFVGRVIALERLTHELALIEVRHGLSRTDVRRFSDSVHHNPSDSHHGWPEDVTRFAATSQDLATRGTPPVEDFLDDRTADLVRLAYDCDYEAYGGLYAEPPRRTLRVAA